MSNATMNQAVCNEESSYLSWFAGMCGCNNRDGKVTR